MTQARYLTKGADSLGPITFDWKTYFSSVGKPATALGVVNVAMMEAVKFFPSLLDSTVLEHYLRFHVINSYAPHLSSAFVDAHFSFHEKEMKGTVEQRPR